MHTVNAYIFAKYIFSRMSHRGLDAHNFDVSEIFFVIGQIQSTGTHLPTQTCHLRLDVRKFNCMKISMSIVYIRTKGIQWTTCQSMFPVCRLNQHKLFTLY